MIKMARILIPSLALLLLIPAGKAQDNEKKYRFEFFGGVNWPIEKHFQIGFPQALYPIKASQEFSLGAQGGVRIAMDGHRHWGQDYAYSYGQNASRFVTPFGRFAFTNRIHQVSSNVLFYPRNINEHRVLPYLTAGIGASFVTLSQTTISQSMDPLHATVGPLKSETIAVFNAGFGFRIRLNERFGLRFDARDYMSRALRYGLPKTSNDPNQPVLPVSGVFHQVAGTVAFVIHF